MMGRTRGASNLFPRVYIKVGVCESSGIVKRGGEIGVEGTGRMMRVCEAFGRGLALVCAEGSSVCVSQRERNGRAR